MSRPRIHDSASPLVGRDEVMRRIGAHLDGTRGPIHVVGPPGIGKTRVLEELARDPARQPCVWIGLEGCRTPDAALQAVAADLQLDVSNRSWEGAAVALDSRAARLLVLDGADDVIDEVLAEAVRLVRRTKAPEVVVASRGAAERLSPGVHVEALDSLDASATATLHHLLTERYDVSPSHRIASEALARVTEGNPLLIELAASLSALVPAEALTARFARGLASMSTDSGSRTDRMLRSIVAHLSPAERRALVSLSLLDPPFELDSVEEVLGQAALPLVERLIRRNLLRREGRGPAGSPALVLHALVRAAGRRALLELDEGEASDLRKARVRAVLRRLEERHITSTRLLEEAFDDATELAPELAVRVALAASESEKASCAAVLQLLERALGLCDGLDLPAETRLRTRVHLLSRLVHTHRIGGSAQAARDYAQQAVEHGRTVTGPLRLAALTSAADVARDASEYDEAEALYREALHAWTPEAGGGALGRARAGLAVLDLHRGALERSVELFEDAVEAFEEDEPSEEELISLSSVGAVRCALGDHERGRATLEEAARRAEEAGVVRARAKALHNLANLAHEENRLDEAATLFEQAAALHGRIGGLVDATKARSGLATVLLHRGDVLPARDLFREVLRVFTRHGNRRWATTDLGSLALADLEVGRTRSAIRRVDAGRIAAEDLGEPQVLCGAWCRAFVVHLLAGNRQAAEEARRAALDTIPEGDRPFASVPRALEAVARLDAGESVEAHDLTGDSALLVAVTERVVGRKLEGQESVVVARDGSWFTLPGRARVELHNRPVLARLLGTLASRSLRLSGASVSADDLVSEVWAGERMTRPSGRNRLRYSIASLRRLGLERVLETVDGGYRLAAEVVVSPAVR